MNPFKRYQKLLEHYLKESATDILINYWTQPERKYHDINHLNDVITYIEENGRNVSSTPQFDALILSGFFHDAVYDIRKPKNHEDDSIELFKELFIGEILPMKNKVIELIECTKHRKKPKDKLCRIFWNADNNGFTKGFSILIKNERRIKEENKHLPKKIYKEKRIKFLKSNLGLFNKIVDKNIEKNIKWVEKNY